jgi:GNAT superfamily N-acetyltransferase
MEVALRPVAADDRSFLLSVYASTRAEELALVDWSDVEKDAFVRGQFEAQDAYYREYYPGATFDVVELDGCPAGRLYVDRWESEIRIVDISLLPEYRGRGVGSVLLRRILAEGAESGKKVSIHVERFNRALALYARLGFVAVEDRGVHLLLEWTPS